MRLFHVSENERIGRFDPRKPTRKDLDQATALVWAISEERLANFLTPRDCPRVTFYARDDSSQADIERFIGDPEISSVLAIEHGWFQKMANTRLTIYEFDPTHFYLQDEVAGYYVSTASHVPIGVVTVDDLFSAIFARNAELRVSPNLWGLCNAVKASSLGYSMCKMANATPPASASETRLF